jgi:hypothetical protein
VKIITIYIVYLIILLNLRLSIKDIDFGMIYEIIPNVIVTVAWFFLTLAWRIMSYMLIWLFTQAFGPDPSFSAVAAATTLGVVTAGICIAIFHISRYAIDSKAVS